MARTAHAATTMALCRNTQRVKRSQTMPSGEWGCDPHLSGPIGRAWTHATGNFLAGLCRRRTTAAREQIMCARASGVASSTTGQMGVVPGCAGRARWCMPGCVERWAARHAIRISI